MDALVELSWRAYPAAAIIAAGLALAALGAAGLARGYLLPVRDRSKPIVWVSGFRMAVVGMAVTGLGAAWLWQQVWLLALALAIGGEELLETSFVLYVLRWGQKQEARHATAA
ncbi:MAG: hypothetical protein U1B78_04480 [Dehalococcoidia bacterium]|nr:hypothetical protein [Dehalococcoidia bacterium]